MKTKLLLATAATCLLASSAMAQVFTDDFNRTNGALGGNWTNTGYVASPLTGFNISSNATTYTTASLTPGVTWNTDAQTLNGVDQEFTAAATVTLNTTASTSFVGLAFNIQDAGNWYALRYSGVGSVQVLRRFNDADNGTVVNATDGFTPVLNRAYRLSVFSDTAYTFDLSITDTTNNQVVYFANNAVDGLSRFTGGYAGLYRGGSAGMTWDDFSVIPEPSSFALLAGALAGLAILRRRRR